MIFLIDEMYPPETVEHVARGGHDATEPRALGLVRDGDIIVHARTIGAVIVTENYADFATATGVVVLFAGKERLAVGSAMASDLADRLVAWAEENPKPGPMHHWL